MATSSRRYRPTSRMYVAAALLVLAAVAVGAAAYVGSSLPLVVAGAAAVVLGAISSRLIYTEVLNTRYTAAADRAAQARAYRALAKKRALETQTVIDGLSTQLVDAHGSIEQMTTTIEDLRVTVGQTAEAREQAVERAEIAEVALQTERERANTAEQAAEAAQARALTAEGKVEESVQRIVDLEAQVHEQQAVLSMRERHTA